MFKLSKINILLIASGVGTASLGIWYSNTIRQTKGSPLDHPISRLVKFDNKNSIINLNITLFQYQTCPFGCKVRAYLDYNGYDYNVIEVNSVTQSQLKWSEYRKVPILLVKVQNELIQLNDSSLIISLLESYKLNTDKSLTKLKDFYPIFETADKRNRKKIDFYNKYQIMKGQLSENIEKDKLEANWRRWVDDEFVHTLAPNIYRTPTEALEAFRYVSECGNWEQHFGYLERQIVIYVGAVAMFFIGKILKNRYNLKENVRESLFDECDVWVKALGSRRFMGGEEQPNLADLAVYGVLNSIEGCSTFRELMERNGEMNKWYLRTKESIKEPYRAVVNQ